MQVRGEQHAPLAQDCRGERRALLYIINIVNYQENKSLNFLLSLLINCELSRKQLHTNCLVQGIVDTRGCLTGHVAVPEGVEGEGGELMRVGLGPQSSLVPGVPQHQLVGWVKGEQKVFSPLTAP